MFEKGKTPGVSKVQPKSTEGVDKGNMEKLEPQQRTMSDVEMAEMKPGLIAPRRRSRNISDSKPAKTRTPKRKRKKRQFHSHLLGPVQSMGEQTRGECGYLMLQRLPTGRRPGCSV